MIDETRQLRWYLGLGLVFVALTSLLMVTLLATGDGAPPGSAIPLIGAPVNLVGVVFVVRSMFTASPEASARLLKIGAAIVVPGTVLLLGVLALTT